MSLDLKMIFMTISELLNLPMKVDKLDGKIEKIDERLDNFPTLFIPRGECDKCHEGFAGKLDMIADLIKKNGKPTS